MKKILLIIGLFICVGITNAQSDATWKKTIDWINEKLKDGGEFQAPYSEGDMNIYNIKYNGQIEGISRYYITTTNLYDVREIEFWIDGQPAMDLILYDEKYAEEIYNNDKSHSNNTTIGSISIHTRDHRALKRLSRAFNRLIKLAKAKRVQYQKTGGEKF